MKKQLMPIYKEMEQQINKISAIQDEYCKNINVNGRRINVQLDNRQIEVIYYKAKEKNAPVIFGAYGGGFVLGGCAYDDNLWSTVCCKFKCNVISIGYRKAPKYQFPCALNDVYDTMCYFINHCEEFEFDKNNVITLGNSSGANLMAAAALLDRKNKTNHIKVQILNYPYLDLATDPVLKKHKDDEIVRYHFFRDKYAAKKEDLMNHFVSPIFASDYELKNMPKSIIICGADDALHDEGEKYAQRLRENGNEVYCKEISGMEHGFIEAYFNLKNQQSESAMVSETMKEFYSSGRLSNEVKGVFDFVSDHLH